jgi:redox-sensitive bicupin YhaK (pirin superfamily)
MMQIRKAEERGGANHGWLKTAHTFSFADYYDEKWMGYRSLRVINDDVVSPSSGFGTHPHRDMEIVTYIVRGALEHRDSLGHGAVLRPGEAQVITAGTGIEHSEFNPSPKEDVHLFQIWLLPERRGLKPAYAQREFPLDQNRGKLVLLAAKGDPAALPINQDARVYAAHLGTGDTLEWNPPMERFTWLQAAAGELEVASGEKSMLVKAGDALYADQPGGPPWRIKAKTAGEIILFDLV